MTQYVVYVVGREYWLPCYVSLYSLLANNPDTEFHVFVLSEEPRDEAFFEHEAALSECAAGLTLEYVRVDESRFDTLPTPGEPHTVGVYFKLALAELLPVDEGRVLVLDVDTVVDGSLEELFDVSLEGYVAAAVPEYRNNTLEFGLPWCAQYFNTGVLYLDLERWRAEQVREKTFAYIREHEPKYHDQDALTVLADAHGWFRPLSPRYNLCMKWHDHAHRLDDPPIVLHYAGEGKPWNYLDDPPYNDRWWSYLERTPFRDYRPERSPSLVLRKQQLRAERFVSRKLERFPRVYDAVAGVYNLVVR